MGWSDVPGLESLEDHYDIRNHLMKYAFCGNARRAGMAAGSVCRLNSMKKGDIVIVPRPGSFHVCRVESENTLVDDSSEAEQQDYRYYRDVTWLTDNAIPRSFAEDSLQRWMKGRQTCLEGGEGMVQEVVNAVQRRSPLDFVEEVRDKAREAVATALSKYINDRDLERLVAKLCASSGADAKILAKSNQYDGDVDVRAVWDLGYSVRRVAFQVKHHDGSTGRHGIEQLVARRDALEEALSQGEIEDKRLYDELCLITTAENVDEGARAYAESNDIGIVTRDDIVDWVLNSGLSSF